MNCPPTKRFRGLEHNVATAYDDSFGDDGDFTQDDLDEIDVIASQAIATSTAGTAVRSKSETTPLESALLSSAWHNKPLSKVSAKQSRENAYAFNSSTTGNAGIPNREPLGTRQQQVGLDREESYSQLEVQHAELKKKLKEVEEEILLKSGEIRVLRDSLRAAHQEKDTQRQNQLLLEMQRQKEQSDKEKELNRKVQSLQSELQFKEAEINEMKTKLHCLDKNKSNSPPSKNSPKVAHLYHGSGSSSSSPMGSGFITKETFGAQLPTRMTPVKTPLKKRRDERTSNSKSGENRQEVSHTDPFLCVRASHLQHRGGILLGLLLQQPLFPSSLSLSHLLSMGLTDIQQISRLSGFLLPPEAASHVGDDGSPTASLSPLQSLAVTGLTRLSQSTAVMAASSNNNRSCPGAVLLLPLLDFHLSRLCKDLNSHHSSSEGRGSDSDAAPSFKADRLQENGLSGFSVEETGLASLRVLYLLLAHSDEVVESVLANVNKSKIKGNSSAAVVDLCSQNSLLQSVLQLCEAGAGSSSSSQKKELVLSAMNTLSVLIKRTPQTHTDRLQCVLPVLCVCLAADSSLQMVLECVSVLMSMSDHQTLAEQICTQHDSCVILKLLQYIRVRPGKEETTSDWTQLDLQVVCLLSRTLTQRAERWTNLQSSCQCYTELVQTVVIIFHRQWLDLRGSQEQMDSTAPQCCVSPSLPWHRGPGASLLRECLLLLHWLLLHHRSFSESCRPLLHMYDQVIPAVRDTLKKIPDLSESEELAMEEICRSEGDDSDDMETDS